MASFQWTPYQYCCFGSELLSSFQNWRETGTLCDYTLICGDTKFPVHKAVLMARSEFFKLMLTSDMLEKNRDTFVMDDMTPDDLKCLIEFMYSDDIELNIENVYVMMERASFLQIPTLEDKVEILCLARLMNFETCVKIWQHGKLYNFKYLVHTAFNFIVNEFLTITHDSLTYNELVDFLSGNRIKVENELDLVDIVKQWMTINKGADFKHIPDRFDEEPWITFAELVSKIRWPLIPTEHLVQNMDKEFRIVMENIPNCATYLREAEEYLTSVYKQPFNQNSRTKVRSDERAIASFYFNAIEYYSYQNGEICQLSKSKEMDYTNFAKVVNVNNFLFVLGAKHLCSGEIFYRYDPRLETWHELAPVPKTSKLTSHFLRTCNKIYRFVYHSQDCWIYNIENNEWSLMEMKPPVIAQPWGAICLIDEAIYISGGSRKITISRDGGDGGTRWEPMKTMCRYDISKKQWDKLTDMRFGRYSHLMEKLRSFIYVIGSGSSINMYDGNAQVTMIERYSIDENQWTEYRPISFIPGCSRISRHHSKIRFVDRRPYIFSEKKNTIDVPGGNGRETMSRYKNCTFMKYKWKVSKTN